MVEVVDLPPVGAAGDLDPAAVGPEEDGTVEDETAAGAAVEVAMATAEAHYKIL